MRRLKLNQHHLEKKWRPNFRQHLLLRAATLTGKDAVDSWLRWKKLEGITKIDWNSRTLLPKIYKNVYEQDYSDELKILMKGLFRKTWYKNQDLFSSVDPVLRKLDQDCQKALLFNGAGMILSCYEGLGHRVMTRIDVLISPKKTKDVVRLLNNLGWSSKKHFPPSDDMELTDFPFGIGFHHSRGQEIRLFGYTLPEAFDRDSEEELWAGAVSIRHKNSKVQVMSPSDQILYSCATAVNWNAQPKLSSLMDAIVLVKKYEKVIDWERVRLQAIKRRIILSVSSVLGFLKEGFDLDVPVEEFARSRINKISKLESQELKLKMLRIPILHNMLKYWFVFKRLELRSATDPVKFQILSFFAYLKNIWGLDHVRQIPLYFLSKITQLKTRFP